MGYGDFKDLNRRTAADKVLRDKAFDIAKNRKYDGYQGGLASMVYNFFVKKTSGGTVKNKIISNKELADELHKSIIRKFEKTYSIYYLRIFSRLIMLYTVRLEILRSFRITLETLSENHYFGQ